MCSLFVEVDEDGGAGGGAGIGVSGLFDLETGLAIAGST